MEEQASIWVRRWILRPVPLTSNVSGILMFERLPATALKVIAHHSVLHSSPPYTAMGQPCLFSLGEADRLPTQKPSSVINKMGNRTQVQITTDFADYKTKTQRTDKVGLSSPVIVKKVVSKCILYFCYLHQSPVEIKQTITQIRSTYK